MTPAQLRAWRLERGLTQEQAARLIIRARSRMIRYEHGQRACRLKRVGHAWLFLRAVGKTRSGVVATYSLLQGQIFVSQLGGGDLAELPLIHRPFIQRTMKRQSVLG